MYYVFLKGGWADFMSDSADAPLGEGAASSLEFLEFRRKVCDSEMLSAAVERLLYAIRFTGRLSIVVQNGRVLKSGYEEGYFCRRKQRPLLS
jgi:hypothetical protein